MIGGGVLSLSVEVCAVMYRFLVCDATLGEGGLVLRAVCRRRLVGWEMRCTCLQVRYGF